MMSFNIPSSYHKTVFFEYNNNSYCCFERTLLSPVISQTLILPTLILSPSHLSSSDGECLYFSSYILSHACLSSKFKR